MICRTMNKHSRATWTLTGRVVLQFMTQNHARKLNLMFFRRTQRQNDEQATTGTRPNRTQTQRVERQSQISTKSSIQHKHQDLTAEDVVGAYRKIAAYPALVGGTIGVRPAGDSTVSGLYNVRTEWSQRDIDKKEKTRFVKTFSLLQNGDAFSCVGSSAPQEMCNVVWDVESPSGQRRVVVLKKKDKKGEDRQYVEIWNKTQKEKTIDVKAVDKHGDIVGSDGQFGSVRWSPCENYLLYIAENKVPKTSSFFEAPTAKDKDQGDSADVTVKGGEYLYKESWGEQLVERHRTVVCRLSVSDGVVTVMSHIPDEYSPGLAVWGPNNSVVFAAWSSNPFRLGLKFCIQRRSFLFKASFDEEEGCIETLSEEGRAVRSPCVSPDMTRLVYLDTPEEGAHNQCSRLVMIDLVKWSSSQNKSEARQVIVDIVSSPYKSGHDPGQQQFPGLYTWADCGCQQNWLSDSVHVLLTSFWRSRSTVVIINTRTKVVRDLNPFDPSPFRQPPAPAAFPVPRLGSEQSSLSPSSASTSDSCAWNCALLDIRDMDVLLTCAWPDHPPFPVLARMSTGPSDRTQWVKLLDSGDSDSGTQPARLDTFQWTTLTLHPSDMQAQHKDFDYLDFEAILYLPVTEDKGQAKPPLVLFPHGGPHSAFDSSFMFNPAVFACCGFAVLCVNYRGSIGFGQDSIHSLLGNVGNLDVKDCVLAMQTVQKSGLVDTANTFVYGGSHGGFLSAQLIGQYPDAFKAAAMRNAVTNLTSMHGLTEIPDWVFVEAGVKFDYGSLADADILKKLWSASPVSHMDKVKTPVMLHIGLKDLRVPPSQSLEYFKMLKARNVPVQCHTYPESNHSLAEVEVEADCMVHSVLWFVQHLAKSTSA